jgi:hypothetical protein
VHRRVFVHVGQRLLNDPDHRLPDRRGHWHRGARHLKARRTHQWPQIGQRYRRRLPDRWLLGQDPDQVAKVVEGGAAGLPDPLGGHPSRVIGCGQPERAGLQHDKADPVCHDIVHLGGKPVAFICDGPLGRRVPVSLGPPGPLAQHVDQTATRRQIQAEKDRHAEQHQIRA